MTRDDFPLDRLVDAAEPPEAVEFGGPEVADPGEYADAVALGAERTLNRSRERARLCERYYGEE